MSQLGQWLKDVTACPKCGKSRMCLAVGGRGHGTGQHGARTARAVYEQFNPEKHCSCDKPPGLSLIEFRDLEEQEMVDPQLYLCVCWTRDNVPDRNMRHGEVTMHIGDVIDPPLTPEEMQNIAYAAKIQFARLMRLRRRARRKQKGK